MDEDQATMIAQAFLMKAVYVNAAFLYKDGDETKIRARAEWLRGNDPLDLAHDPGWKQDRNRSSLDLLGGEDLVQCFPDTFFSLGKDEVSFYEVRGRG